VRTDLVQDEERPQARAADVRKSQAAPAGDEQRNWVSI
jgi:hypothetical protein